MCNYRPQPYAAAGCSVGSGGVTRTVERDFDRTPRALVAALLDEEFLAARGAALGGTATPTLTRDGDLGVVRFPRRVPLDDVPGPLRALAGNGEVVQVERWESVTDERCTATWTTETKMPGAAHGTYEVVATPGGCTYTVTATAKVNVPLVGGRLTTEVEGHVARLIEAELDFVTSWLAR
jgi:hypothetical protein